MLFQDRSSHYFPVSCYIIHITYSIESLCDTSTSGTKEETRYSSLFDVAVMPTASLPACLCEGISLKETEHDGKKHEVFLRGVNLFSYHVSELNHAFKSGALGQ